MIDFNSEGFFARLKKVAPSSFGNMIEDFFIDGERIIGAYQSDGDNAGLFLYLFSLETAGVFDLDAELEIYMSGVGKVKFQFTGSTDVKDICKVISTYALS